MDMFDKLKILSDAAKYDAACTSSGVDRGNSGGIGNAVAAGICHSFTSDGRCVSLLKILMSNACSFDCAYCVNRRSSDTPRATFTPKEIADLTINFYKRNYIEGLFLSSGVLGDATRTTELMVAALEILRYEYKFFGYIHAKAIPGAQKEALDRLMLLCDRVSINIELPSNESLTRLAPDKTKHSILEPMGYIKSRVKETAMLGYKGLAIKGGGAFGGTSGGNAAGDNTTGGNTASSNAAGGGALTEYKGGWRADRYAPAGQSTQMIIGASNESDLAILRLTEGLYQKYSLKRVFFSAYIPVSDNPNLPALDTKPPLLRENRLYQADWLMRFYGFKSNEILDEDNPQFNPYLDPKCNWAVNHPQFFPVEINKADIAMLLRVPGIGVNGAKKIVAARRHTKLDFCDLKRLNVVLKRAKYFILCSGKSYGGLKLNDYAAVNGLLSKSAIERLKDTESRQISMFDNSTLSIEDVKKSITGQL